MLESTTFRQLPLPRHARSACAQRTAGITLDHAAPLYDHLAPLMMLGTEARMHRHVLARLDLPHARSLLDVGCGTGTLTRDLYNALPDTGSRWVVGIDAAEAMIQVARRKYPRLTGLQFDPALAEDLPYPAATFDRVVSTFFFHHLPAPLKARALDELWRVLRPGGRGVILDVDIPCSRFGHLCALAGYHLFHQPEIKENIDGHLRLALVRSRFHPHWDIASRHSGYVSLFVLTKPETTSDTTQLRRDP